MIKRLATSAVLLSCLAFSGCLSPVRQDPAPLPSLQTAPGAPLPDYVAPCKDAVPFAAPSTKKRVIFHGVSIEIVDNPLWPPAAEESGSLAFGTPRWTEALSMGRLCELVRDFTLSLETEPATLSFLQTQYGDFATVTEKRIGNVDTIVLDQFDGVCPSPFIVILGKEPLRLATSCEASLHLTHPLQLLEEIVQSVRIE